MRTRLKLIGLSLVLGVILSALTGCSTTKPQPPPDPVKVAQVGAIAESVASTGTLIAIQRAPASKPYLAAASVVLCELSSQQDVTPEKLQAALEAMPVNEFRTPEAVIVTAAVVTIYRVAWASRLRADIGERPYLQAVLSALCRGIKAGL